MAPPTYITVGPLAAANAALIAASQTPVSGTPLTLTGVNPDKARRVLLTYGNEVSARTLQVRGTNSAGNPISETLAVPSGGGGTAATLLDYLTITSLTPLGGGWSAAVTVGTNTVGSSEWKLIDNMLPGSKLSLFAIVTGTVGFEFQYTYDDPNNTRGDSNVPPVTWQAPSLFGLTGTIDGEIDNSAYAWRVQINSGTGTIKAGALQSGVRA
jgi:hypothetical protein